MHEQKKKQLRPTDYEQQVWKKTSACVIHLSIQENEILVSDPKQENTG